MKKLICIAAMCALCGTIHAQGERMKSRPDTIYQSEIHEKMLNVLIANAVYVMVKDVNEADIVFIKPMMEGRKIYYFKKTGGDGAGHGLRTASLNNYSTVQPRSTTIHGNVLYNLDYRGLTDTPFSQKDIYQHTVQVYLEIAVKNKYPLRVYLTNRFSNSMLFRNFYDVNLQYSPQQFHTRLKQKMKSLVLPRLKADSLEKLAHSLRLKKTALHGVRSWMSDPGIAQKMIEARERIMMNKAGVTLAERSDSNWNLPQPLEEKGIEGVDRLSDSNFVRLIAEKKKILDSLEKEVSVLEKEYQRIKTASAELHSAANEEIDKIQSLDELDVKLKELNIPDTALPKGYRFLFALKSFGVGRNILDYSELSARNISVTGLALEYNPGWYFAFATGAVDYRFRDYIVQHTSQARQYLNIVRIGRGIKSRNNIIFSLFHGKRQLYNTATISGQAIPNYRLFGYTIEGRYRLNRNSYLVGEVAKSSLPYYSLGSKDENIVASSTRFNDRSNEAYSVKLVSYWPKTGTRINMGLKRIGSNFQSFSVFTSGSAQTNWNVRVDQHFFKKQLSVSAAVRTNEFSNPYIGSTYSSSAIFKSVQATMRIKKLPVVSVGYFPSSQLTRLTGDRLVENQFYTLSATASHFYRLKNTGYSTVAVFTQFYNKAIDSGFTYFNSKNLLLAQSAFVGKFSVGVNATLMDNLDYSIYTVGGTLDYAANERFSFGAGMKYNRQTVFQSERIGFSGNASLIIRRLGEIRINMERGFIPSYDRQLLINNTGQLTYFKTF